MAQGRYRRAVQGHQTALLIKGPQQGRVVTKADHNFWLPPDRFKVEIVQNPHGAITAAGADNRLDIVVIEIVVYQVGAMLIRACQIALFCVKTFRNQPA